MFWKRKHKCPIKVEDKEWVDEKLAWINAKIIPISQQETILPTNKYFNYQFTGQEEDAQFALKRIGEFFKIMTAGITLEFYSEGSIQLDENLMTEREDYSGTAGWYMVDEENKHSIWIEENQLQDPQSMIATIAHELSHFVLIGQKNIYLEGEENELLTDLVTIAYGFGVFLGNSKFGFNQWQAGDGWGGWSFSNQGYLPQEIIAYAMAKIEIGRSDTLPTWKKYLRKSFYSDFKTSFLFLKNSSTLGV